MKSLTLCLTFEGQFYSCRCYKKDPNFELRALYKISCNSTWHSKMRSSTIPYGRKQVFAKFFPLMFCSWSLQQFDNIFTSLITYFPAEHHFITLHFNSVGEAMLQCQRFCLCWTFSNIEEVNKISEKFAGGKTRSHVAWFGPVTEMAPLLAMPKGFDFTLQLVEVHTGVFVCLCGGKHC